MIITEELLCSMGACNEGITPLKELGLLGLTRREFIRGIKKASDDGLVPIYYYNWSAEILFKYSVIKANNTHIKTDKYRAVGVNSTIIGEFTTKAQATSAALAARQAYNETNAKRHHVIARVKVQEGHIIEDIDLNSKDRDISEAESYDAFNINTGLYESFKSFSEAKTRALELRAAEEALTDFSFAIEEEIQEADPDPEVGIVKDWAPLEPI
jgi:hypothetical protein